MTSAIRARTMRAVKSKNTKPELIVRKLIYSLGYRYRLHRKDLPGCPDLVFTGQHKVIFVHGCFWHRHDCKRGARAPKENAEYWRTKIKRNIERDLSHKDALKKAGWKSLVVWECEIKNAEGLEQRIRTFLNRP